MTKTVGLCAVVSLMFMVSSALAETSTTICWGQYKTPADCKNQDVNADCSHTCALNSYTAFYPCGSGGHSGFNPAYACTAVCGKPQNQGCTIKAGPSTDGNKCGYRWATMVCN
jgi:hypothetical protein